jgi:hypothetical protein
VIKAARLGNKIQIEIGLDGIEIVSPEEAVSFATKLINLAYPLTKTSRSRK